MNSFPLSPTHISEGEEIATRLRSLIGTKFPLAPGRNKTKTDGANLRKRVALLLSSFELPPAAAPNSCTILPPRSKGITKLRREWIDSFIVTSGEKSYNLQVWNRNPAEPIPHVEYADGSYLRANDIRFVLVRVDPVSHLIRCVIVTTPDYVVAHFGEFGKPTTKEQLLIREQLRTRITSMFPPILYHDDIHEYPIKSAKYLDGCSIRNSPETDKIIPLNVIRDFVEHKLIGMAIPNGPTKVRGQLLEEIVASGLGYTICGKDRLLGGFPDIRHQALEVKIQDGPTVDLGKYSPQFEEPVPNCPGFTTQTVRYLIALMDQSEGRCVGAILCPGERLGQHFVYVADGNFKCQRSIPFSFFDTFEGRSVFNPEYPKGIGTVGTT